MSPLFNKFNINLIDGSTAITLLLFIDSGGTLVVLRRNWRLAWQADPEAVELAVTHTVQGGVAPGLANNVENTVATEDTGAVEDTSAVVGGVTLSVAVAGEVCGALQGDVAVIGEVCCALQDGVAVVREACGVLEDGVAVVGEMCGTVKDGVTDSVDAST